MTAFPGSINLKDAIEIENGKLIRKKDLVRWYFEARLVNLEKHLSIVPDVKSKGYETYRAMKLEATNIMSKLSEF